MITIQKRWFHATTKENWEKIKQEKILWGISETTDLDNPIDKRATFLARELKTLISMVTDKTRHWNGDMLHNELILSVRYLPNNINDDYDPSNWEMIVKKPIPLSNVKVLKYL